MGHETITFPLHLSCFLRHVLLHACFSSLCFVMTVHTRWVLAIRFPAALGRWCPSQGNRKDTSLIHSKLIRPPDISFVTAIPYTFLVYLVTDHTLELSKLDRSSSYVWFTIINCIGFWRENERVNCAAAHRLHMIG